jgi:predicted transcriptional regulator
MTSNGKQVERFLEAYRHLEATAAKLLPRDTRNGVIARLIRQPKFAAYREELDCCREVRNLLTHEVRVEGEPAVIPSDGMIRFLERMTELINDPPRVRHRMTPFEKLLVVAYDSPVLPVMEQMRARDLSRVPLLSDGKVRGMFSSESVFRATLDGVTITEDSTMEELRAYLPLDAASNTVYRFVAPEMTLEEAEEMFYQAYGKKSKIRALLVTEGASEEKPLLGIVSPYDLLGDQARPRTCP